MFQVKTVVYGRHATTDSRMLAMVQLSTIGMKVNLLFTLSYVNVLLSALAES
jgi:hypothetical protein